MNLVNVALLGMMNLQSFLTVTRLMHLRFRTQDSVRVAILFLSLFAVTARADDSKSTTVSQKSEAVELLDQRLAELDAGRSELMDRLRAARAAGTDVEREWKQTLREADELNQAIGAAEKQAARQQERVASTAKEQTSAMDAIEIARLELELAQQRLRAAELNLSRVTGLALQAETKANARRSQVKELESKRAPLQERVSTAEQRHQAASQVVAQLDHEASQLEAQRTTLRAEIEKALQAEGDWVSFASQIAPIFQQRCIPCHNVRDSQGQYNMMTYASLMAAGASGRAVEPGNPDLSSLHQFVIDGWMPYETDPLTDEQIELIGRWIQQGARIDVAASPDSPLIQIMPRVEQPAAPAVYNAPIPVTALAHAPKQNWLASGGYHEVLLWDAQSGELIKRIGNLARRIHAIDFHPEGNVVAVAAGTPGQLGEVKVIELESGKVLNDTIVSDDSMLCVRFSPDGATLAAAGTSGDVVVLDWSQEGAQPRVFKGHADWVNDLAWSPAGDWIATASRDKSAKLFNVATGEIRVTYSDHQANVTAVAFAGNDRVMSAGDDRKIRIWRTSDGNKQREIGNLGGEVNALAVDGEQQVVSVCSDGMVRKHNGDNGNLIASVAIEFAWLSSCSRSPDGSLMYIGDHNGQIHVVSIEEGTVQKSWLAVPSKSAAATQE